jgi:multicomponent Na+:H+ antiporter subunit E
MAYWMILGLWLLYLALTSNLEPGNLVIGLMLATALTLLLRPQPARLDWRRAPMALLALGRYAAVVIRDAWRSGIGVARILINPELPIAPGIIAVPSGCTSELATALSAHAITLAPGEMVIAIDRDGVMYTHALDTAHSAEFIAQTQALRRHLLSKIFR